MAFEQPEDCRRSGPATKAEGAILQFPRALDEPACAGLIDLFKRRAALASSGGKAGKLPPAVLMDETFPPRARERMLAALRLCQAKIAMPMASDTRSLYPETLALAVLGPGEDIGRHVDNGRFSEDGQWVRNEAPQRCLSAVFYLNGDFEGGEIVFDKQDLAIRPEPGLLIVFPSGRHFPHSVRRVERGWRYTMPLWFTTHRWHALLPDSIPFKLKE